MFPDACRRWQLCHRSVPCGTVVLDGANIRELDDAVEAHRAWLISKGVEVPVPAAQLTALEALLLFEEAKANHSPLEDKRVMAIMSGLIRVLRFRARAVGLERFVMESRKRRRDLIARKKQAGAPRAMLTKLRRDTKAVEVAHDERAVLLLEARGRELQKRLRSFDAGLTTYVKWQGKRQSRFNAAGYGSAKLLAPTRYNLVVAWMRSQLAHLSLELDWFLDDARGTAATDPLGHSGGADAKAWHRLRGDCLLALQREGVRARIRDSLFPSGKVAASREKDRNQKRVSRAKKRIKAKT